MLFWRGFEHVLPVPFATTIAITQYILKCCLLFIFYLGKSEMGVKEYVNEAEEASEYFLVVIYLVEFNVA